MPVLIVIGLIGALLAKFPYTSAISIVGILYCIVWSAKKNSRLRQLERQRYLDDVAAFQWRDGMDPIEFERRCAEAMRLAGWAAQTTKGSGDQGVDVLAERDGIRVVLQCKRYTNSVGNKAVQEAFAAKTFANARFAAVVTNSQFTPAARTLATSTGVLLLHFTDLAHPNRLFGLPDMPFLHRPSGVTEAQISQLRQSKIKPAYALGFIIVFGVALVHDLYQGDVNTPLPPVSQASIPPENVTPPTSNAGNPETVLAPNQQPKSVGSANTPLSGAATPRQSSLAGSGPKPQPRAALKTTLPALLRDGSTFCAVASDFDKRWRWSISGDQAHEPSTPSCVLVFGQPHPMRVSVLHRLGSNKTMIRIEEGDLAGRTGYTDAYLP